MIVMLLGSSVSVCILLIMLMVVPMSVLQPGIVIECMFQCCKHTYPKVNNKIIVTFLLVMAINIFKSKWTDTSFGYHIENLRFEGEILT